MAPVSSAANNNSHPLSPSTTAAATTSLQDMSAAAAAIALDMKPKGDLAQTQKIKKLVRRNASDKLKLIQMVHDNPILWDSRLPNFKGAEEEKNRAWEHIGKEFNAPGRRVARAFKSLRESYRRELAHVKLMGSGFKPKWSLYEAMDFLRDVIRERKGGSHAAEALTMGINLNISALAAHHMNHANNNNNINNNNNNNNDSSKSNVKENGSLHSSSFGDAALNLSKCSAMSQEDYYYYVKPELDLSTNSNNVSIGGGVGSATSNQPLPAHQAQLHHHLHQHQHQQQQQQHQQQQQQQQQQHQQLMHNDSRVSSTRNDTTQNTSFDDIEVSSLRSGDDDACSTRNAPLSNEDISDEVEELEAIDADFPYPLILDSNSPTSADQRESNCRKRRRRHMGDLDDVGGDAATDDDYEDQMLQQHRHLRQQHNGSMPSGLDIPPPQTVREVLNSKFCGFISAKLNSMEDSEADNLMNRILMLLVQTQVNEGK